MTTVPEEAVKAADIIQVITDLRSAILQDDDEGLAEHAAPMVKAKELIVKLSASPFLPVQGAVKKLEETLRELITDQSEGEWDEKTIEKDVRKFSARILSALEPAATCNESLQVEPAAPEGQQPVADALELSGNTGELIDRMAAAIRDWGSHYDDGPWEALPEDRKAGWRGDAERALAVVKEYLTARRPSEQAVTEAMELARAVLAQSITAGHNVHGPTPEDIEEAFWALDAALKSAMEAPASEGAE